MLLNTKYEFHPINSSTFAVVPPLPDWLKVQKYPGILRAAVVDAPCKMGNCTQPVMVIYCEQGLASVVMDSLRSALIKTLGE